LIFGISQRAISATGFLQEAAGDSDPAASMTGTLLTAWPALGTLTSPGDFQDWTTAQWAEFLDDPLHEHPSATGAEGDRRAVFHLHLALGHDEGLLDTDQWTYAAHTVLASLGLSGPEGDGNHRWVALRTTPRHLHLIANLIAEDGTWAALPEPLLLHMRNQVRDLVDTFNGQQAPHPITAVPAPRGLPDRLGWITDEASGPLAKIRREIEQAAMSAAASPELQQANADARLAWIARRLHGIQEDLRDITFVHSSAPAAPRHPLSGQGTPPPAAAATSNPSAPALTSREATAKGGQTR
jgi:hypothetical protein